MGRRAQEIGERSIDTIFALWSHTAAGSAATGLTLGQAPEQVDSGWDEAELLSRGVSLNGSVSTAWAAQLTPAYTPCIQYDLTCLCPLGTV